MRGQWTRRVERAVTEELERVPLNVLVPDFVTAFTDADACMPFCGESARGDAEFLQRVGERHRQVHVALRAVVRRPVEQVADADGQAAGDRDGHASGKVPAADDSGLHHRTGQHDQISHLPALQRQLEDPLVVHDVADAGAPDIDERRSRSTETVSSRLPTAITTLMAGVAATCSDARLRRCGTPGASLPADTGRWAGSAARMCRSRPL